MASILPGATGNNGGLAAFIKARWKPLSAAVSLAVIALTLVLVLPPLMGRDDEALARDIALNSAEVQAAMEGYTVQQVAATRAAGDIMRVVISVSAEQVVIADVDVRNDRVASVQTMNIADITEEEIFAVAQADPRVQELMSEGYSLFHYGDAVSTPPPLRTKNCWSLSASTPTLMTW